MEPGQWASGIPQGRQQSEGVCSSNRVLNDDTRYMCDLLTLLNRRRPIRSSVRGSIKSVFTTRDMPGTLQYLQGRCCDTQETNRE
jgi:hypothetical protein